MTILKIGLYKYKNKYGENMFMNGFKKSYRKTIKI